MLIIDPSSGQVINNEDRHQWSNAYKIDMSTSAQYFQKWLQDDSDADPVVDSAELRRLYAEIDEFEQHLANRVAAGYARVSAGDQDIQALFPTYPLLSWESE